LSELRCETPDLQSPKQKKPGSFSEICPATTGSFLPMRNLPAVQHHAQEKSSHFERYKQRHADPHIGVSVTVLRELGRSPYVRLRDYYCWLRCCICDWNSGVAPVHATPGWVERTFRIGRRQRLALDAELVRLGLAIITQPMEIKMVRERFTGKWRRRKVKVERTLQIVKQVCISTAVPPGNRSAKEPPDSSSETKRKTQHPLRPNPARTSSLRQDHGPKSGGQQVSSEMQTENRIPGELTPDKPIVLAYMEAHGGRLPPWACLLNQDTGAFVDAQGKRRNPDGSFESIQEATSRRNWELLKALRRDSV
jgi:hypothetical protein